MCIFSQPVDLVADTHIFARLANGTQFVAYEMQLSTLTENAMILPVPIARGVGEDALEFISLEDYPDFFDDLEALFPGEGNFGGGDMLGVLAAPAKLTVHRVGSFEASFVPTIADFDRLDPRFNLSPEAWEALPQVQDYGFAVFQLVAGEARHVHPMAFSFPTRSPGRIVFPTIHVHDGEVHEQADFDHLLFCQHGELGEIPPGESIPSLEGWEESHARTESFVDPARTGGLVVERERCYRRVMTGTFDNQDVTVDLSGIRGEASTFWETRPAEEKEDFQNRQARLELARILIKDGLTCPQCGLHSSGYRFGGTGGPANFDVICGSCGEASLPSDFSEVPSRLGLRRSEPAVHATRCESAATRCPTLSPF